MLIHNLLKRPDAAIMAALEDAFEAIHKGWQIPRNHKGDLPYAIRDLSRLLTQERSSLSQSYWQLPRFISAYTHFFLPWNLYRLSWLLPGLDLPFTDGARIVDLGSGPLTLPLALWCSRPELRTRALHFTCYDVAMRPMEIGRDIFQLLAGTETPWTFSLTRAPVDVALKKMESPVSAIFAGNVLNELLVPRSSTLEQFVDQLVQLMEKKVEPDGRLLLIEPGTRLGGKMISVARKCALHKGLQPLAPCVHTGPCPAMEQQQFFADTSPYSGWCHFIYPAEGAPQSLQALSKSVHFNRDTLAISCFLAKKDANAHVQASTAKKSGSVVHSELDELEALYEEMMAEDAAESAWTPQYAPRMNDLQPVDTHQKSFAARVISDVIRVPYELEVTRYGCSERGLVLIRDALRLPSGAGLEVSVVMQEQPGAGSLEQRDAKSGALLVDWKGSHSRKETPPEAPSYKDKTDTQKKRSVPAKRSTTRSNTRSATRSTKRPPKR